MPVNIDMSLVISLILLSFTVGSWVFTMMNTKKATSELKKEKLDSAIFDAFRKSQEEKDLNYEKHIDEKFSTMKTEIQKNFEDHRAQEKERYDASAQKLTAVEAGNAALNITMAKVGSQMEYFGKMLEEGRVDSKDTKQILTKVMERLPKSQN